MMFIAVSQRNNKDKYGNLIDNLENNYVNYLEKFGINVIAIPNSIKDVAVYFKSLPVKGIILSGGNDINPELYGKEIQIELSISNERDQTEKKILEMAIEKKLPVLGICRGMQFINVFFKGKLSKIDDHVGVEHSVKIEDEEVKVNSYHNYGIKERDLSLELKSFAQTEDGIIEGIYHPSLPIAGIQWHPERRCSNKESNEKIIKAFAEKNLFWKP